MAADVTIHNAALSGVTNAILAGRGVKSTTSYTVINAACNAFAAKVNTVLACGALGAGKEAPLLAGICEAVMMNRNIVSSTANDYATDAATITALYTAAAAKLQ